MAKKSMKRGVFITFEGPEGCGKSTHSRLFCDYLRKLSIRFIHTREPGGTKTGEQIRRILLHSGSMDISDLAELFLFEASRSQLVAEVVRPALADRNIVICDRFSDATMSYQGYGGRVSLAAIRALNRIATGGLKPDLTILLDIDTAEGLRRAREKGIDRMERKDIDYHRRVRAGYLKIAKDDPRRVKVVRVNHSIEKTQALVRSKVEPLIKKYRGS